MAEATFAAITKLDGLRIGEDGAGLDVLHLPAFGEILQVSRHEIDNLLPVAADAVDVDARLAEMNADFVPFARVGNQLGGMQECFRRDAADMETGPAWPFTLIDKRDLHSLVGGMKGRRITTWTGADNEQFAF